MTLLSRCPGGTLLEPAIEREATTTGDINEAEAIRQQVIDGLLWYQKPICDDTEHRMVAFVAGYGAGKTRTLCAWATLMSLDNPGCIGVLFAPTGPLVRDVLIRSLEDYWTELGITFEYRASPLPEFKLYLPMGTSTVLCRSMENWSRIIGTNAAWIGADEIDTSKTEIAQRAVEKFLGRLRAGNRRQLGMFSTPEGFGILYHLFVEQGDKTDRALYRAKSTDNPHLPEDFIEGMRENYPPAMLKSYLDGEFTNLTQASVYPEFNRDLNLSAINAPTESDTLWIGVDFNVARCWLAVCVQRGDGVHVIAEHIARDTPGVIATIREHYGAWADHNQLIVCPDASSQSRSTKDAGISDFGLMKQAGLRLQTQASNPFIRDRVLTVNSLILNAKGERRLFVHPDCKGMIKGLEQHAFDQATQQPEKGDGGELDLSGQMDALGYACWQLAGITAYGSRGHNRKGGMMAKRKVKLY
jgi:phage terminase large subunit-like protein